MIKVTYEDQLNISTDPIEYLLALIKITNIRSSAASDVYKRQYYRSELIIQKSRKQLKQ